MPQIPVPIVLLLGLTSLFSAFMAACAFSRQRLRGAREFGLLASAITLDAMGYTVEISRTKLSDILLAVKFEYLGTAFIASFGLYFVLAFTRSSPQRKRTVDLILIQPALTLLVVWTTELHGLSTSNRIWRTTVFTRPSASSGGPGTSSTSPIRSRCP